MLYKDDPDWVSARPVDITCHSHTSMTCVGPDWHDASKSSPRAPCVCRELSRCLQLMMRDAFAAPTHSSGHNPLHSDTHHGMRLA
jgi:hypothetical protein